FTRLALILCYVLYLSILYAGQDFTSFQWDLFLLEAGFLAIFLCGGSFIVVFLYRWLLFRFMFFGGLVKIASGDPNWRNLTALAYHYETQPLPSPIAWYAHQLPVWGHQFCVVGIFLIELVIPFCIFMPRSLRLFAAWSFLVLQGGIILTGNYNFFNLLTIAICLFLCDDRGLSRLLGSFGVRKSRLLALQPGRLATLCSAILALVVLISNATLAWSSNRPMAAPQPWYALMEATLTLGIANTYGPFAVMTTQRGEIEIEASMNGRDWLPYEFVYKPGPLDKGLTWLIPHQPRLDWQMWFAALRPDHPPYWFGRLMNQLGKASPPVLALLQRVPFPGLKPRWVRASFYQYHFTDPDERKSTRRIWKREYLGLYWLSE
ncbi:MAG: lipase maturation factor family protein, partial [Methylococcales bacterium]